MDEGGGRGEVKMRGRRGGTVGFSPDALRVAI